MRRTHITEEQSWLGGGYKGDDLLFGVSQLS
jgi:hypothetical protein